jgi:hypothetical protein
MQPSQKLLSSMVAFVVIAGIDIPVLAFSHPLSSTAIRDAYFLGSRHDLETAEFLAQYAHQLPAPKTGPYVNEIGIDTPFTEIVRRSAGALNYGAPDAVEEYQHKPMTVSVHVDIALTPSYSPIPEPTGPALYQFVPDFWNDFQVKVIQGNQVVPAEHRRGGPFYFYGDGGTPSVTGARIELDYDPAQIEADSTTIEVVTPDGQKVETAFDLGKLR